MAGKETIGSSAMVNATVPQQMVSHFTGAKIGRPGYKLIKIRDPVTRYLGIRIQVHYPTPFAPKLPRPLTRLMSAFEQRQEAPNKLYQYLLVAAPMYETVAVKVPAKEIYSSWSYWDEDTRLFTHELTFKQ